MGNAAGHPGRSLIVALILLVATTVSAGCNAAPAPGTQGAGGSGEQAAPLQLTVVAQQGQIDALKGQVAALQTSVAAPAPAAAQRPPAIPTLMPAVQGIPVDGTTKGLASAKVVLDEYSDFQ